MNKKDLTHRITVRLTDSLNQGLAEMAEFYCVTPSDMVRQLISTNVNLHREMRATIANTVEKAKDNAKTSDEEKKSVKTSDKTSVKRQTKSKK